MYLQKSDTQVYIADIPRKKPLPRGKKFMIITAVAVLAVTIGFTVFSIEKIFSLKYEHAVSLMDSNNYLDARAEFLRFSGYRDSSAKARECQNMYDFHTADAMLKSGDYLSARKIFASLEDFSGAPEKVRECDYDAATDMMEAGKTESAKEAFIALGDFLDSEEKLKQCQTELDYIAAVGLFNKQDYPGALDAFVSLKGYKDSDSRAFECNNHINYAKAEKAFSEGNFYTAYIGFLNLGYFSDSADRAAACIQPDPKSGETYRNRNYSKKTCPLTFKTPKSGYSMYIKIYYGSNLISSVFIASGKKVTVKLPAGTYIIKGAAGENWFGPNEAFGDDAYYGIVYKKYTMKRGWVYSITFGAGKGASESTEIERSDF